MYYRSVGVWKQLFPPSSVMAVERYDEGYG